MKSMTKNLMAAALLMALPVGASFACTTTAWNGNTGAAAGAEAGGPLASTGGFARYSGDCALRTGAGEFVTDNTPGGTGSGGESVYRARFYVLTSGTGKVFSATTGDSNGGAEVVGVTFDGSAFTFSGATGVSPIPATANRWYSVEISHNSGGAFSAVVQGNGGATATTQSGTSAAASVGSASLGLLAGTGSMIVDEFESTRSADTAIGRLCPGDTNASGTYSATDLARIRNEILTILSASPVLAGGQPDANESGGVTATDISVVRAKILALQTACP